MSATSEQTRFEVTRAVSTSGKYPALAKQAAQARTHYLEIRKHFFEFVKGLHGLGGQTTELQGVDGKKFPDLLALSTDIDSLKVKVDALGELKHADTPMQGAAGDLSANSQGEAGPEKFGAAMGKFVVEKSAKLKCDLADVKPFKALERDFKFASPI